MRVYLIRLVENYVQDDLEIPAIRLFQDVVDLQKSYLNQYVLAELDIYKGQLNIHIQSDEEDLLLIEQKEFPVRFGKRKY